MDMERVNDMLLSKNIFVYDAVKRVYEGENV